MKVVIIGATGGVAGHLIPILTGAGHQVVGLHRKDAQARELQRMGATPRQGDLMEMESRDFDPVISGADAVVFSAGAGGAGIEQATKIDGDAPGKLVAAMGRTGVGRLVLVSVFMDAGRNSDMGETFEHYMAEKRRADVDVAASDLDWVLIRPGTLIDGAGDGQVTAGRAIAYGDVARGNVARTIAGVLARPALSREIIELADGTTPVEAALDALTR